MGPEADLGDEKSPVTCVECVFEVTLKENKRAVGGLLEKLVGTAGYQLSGTVHGNHELDWKQGLVDNLIL